LGAGYLEGANDFLHPALPLDDGDRIIGIRTRDAASAGYEPRTVHDFLRWREALQSVGDLGAFRGTERNLTTADGQNEPVRGAELSAAAFQIARIPPLLGRPLLAADEQPAAAPVIVLGYDVWQKRFGGDARIVGRTVRVGGVISTVVGVMPAGFAFPMNHEFWLPLRLQAAYEPREGPKIQVFGRLKDGVSREEAQAELTALGQRAAAEFPKSHEHLRPEVIPYTQLFFGGGTSWQLYMLEFVFLLLLVVICANVAIMLFARTATRESEIVVRFALGASRGKIIAQLFVEAIVLALVAAVVGLAAARWVLAWAMQQFWSIMGERIPFWWNDGIALSTVLYAGALAILAGLLAGVVPALKATGARVQDRLRHVTVGGGSGMRFGGWTAVIVTQIAFSVALLPIAIGIVWGSIRAEHIELGFPAQEYISARLEIDPEQEGDATISSAETETRFQSTIQELRRRVLLQPGVINVSFADRFPGMDHSDSRMEVEGVTGTEASPLAEAQSAAVDPNFFETLQAPIVSGRGFHSSDYKDPDRETARPPDRQTARPPDRQTARPHAVVVNESFVLHVLHSRNPLGQRIRYVSRSTEEPGPWHEIVGVVRNLGMDRNIKAFGPATPPGFYRPLTAREMARSGAYTVRMAVHVRGEPTAYTAPLRAIAGAVDPTLRVYDLLPLNGTIDLGNRAERLFNNSIAAVCALIALLALFVSAAGTYSLMSFIVSKRTREIGIRSALGANPRRIVAAIFSRALAQIGLGVFIGLLVWILLILRAPVDETQSRAGVLGLLLGVAALMMIAGVLACTVPARRALRIQPTEALKEA
jgi:putative ABC transport system permease protein